MTSRPSVLLSALAVGLAGSTAALPSGAECIGCYRHVVTSALYGSFADNAIVRAPRKLWQVTRGGHVDFGHAGSGTDTAVATAAAPRSALRSARSRLVRK
jgi:hypothetical protein